LAALRLVAACVALGGFSSMISATGDSGGGAEVFLRGTGAPRRSGEEAVQLCSKRGEHDSFDLLIVDMVMPGGLNGLSTVAQIRRRRPQQKALIASGYAPEHLSAAAAREGLPWLSKPYTLGRLASAVRHAIGGSGSDPAGDAVVSGLP
jgi:CheY-like chemotaxis protein